MIDFRLGGGERMPLFRRQLPIHSQKQRRQQQGQGGSTGGGISLSWLLKQPSGCNVKINDDNECVYVITN